MMTQPLTLKQAFNRLLEGHWDGLRCYRSVASNVKHLEEILGADIPLSQIDDKVVGNLVKALKDQGNTPTTINRKLSTLQTTLKVAHEDWQVIKEMPRFKKFRTKEKNGRIKVLEVAEEDQLISLFRESGESEIADLMVVLVDTGMRLSEALRLESRDVNLQQNMVFIWESKNDIPRGIPITKRVRAILRRRTESSGRIFSLSVNRVEYVFRKVRAVMGKAHDKEFTIHALRHTCASRLVQRGAPLYEVQKILGHSTIAVTERYAHLNPHHLRSAINLLERDEQVPPSYSVRSK